MFFLGLILFQPASVAESALPVAQVRIARQVYQLEVAATSAQAEQGLMYRTQLAAHAGMLFPFAEVKPVAFWMKNTKIPLDMLFIRNQTVVHVVNQAPPCLTEQCPIYTSEYPVDSVIELAGGTAKKQHIHPGTTIQLEAKAASKPF